MSIKPGVWEVFSESKRIINGHPRHFLSLLLIFLLPLSFSIITSPVIFSFTPDQPFFTKTHLLYIVFVNFFSLCAVGTITYSVFQAFHGRPLKLLPAIRSLSKSLIPLLVTSNCMQLVFLAINCVLVILALALMRALQTEDWLLYWIALVVLASVLIYGCLQVNWGLASAVVVVESCWGFKALRRSGRLIRGMRRVWVGLILVFGCLTGGLTWIIVRWELRWCDSSGCGWKNWRFLLITMLNSAIISLTMLHELAANTVLYVYCKAMQGEVENFLLPSHDGKLPQLVSAVDA